MTAPNSEPVEDPPVEGAEVPLPSSDAGASLHRDNFTTPDVKADQNKDLTVGASDNG